MNKNNKEIMSECLENAANLLLELVSEINMLVACLQEDDVDEEGECEDDTEE